MKGKGGMEHGYSRNSGTVKNYGGSYEAADNEAPRKFVLKEKISEMMKYGMPLTDKFPRRNRKTADMMRDCMLSMYRYATEIEKKFYKKTTVQNLDVELAVLKELVVMASDKSYCGDRYAPPLTIHEREVWARHNDEIGRIIGGYIKSLSDREK
jgi:hypothetical protein